MNLGAREEWGCRGEVGAADGEVCAADGEGGANMQSGVAQRRGHEPLTNPSVFADPGSTPTKFSTFCSQSKRDWKKT